METAKTMTDEVELKQIIVEIEQQAEKMVLEQLVTPDKIITSSSEQLERSTSLLQGIMQQGSSLNKK